MWTRHSSPLDRSSPAQYARPYWEGHRDQEKWWTWKFDCLQSLNLRSLGHIYHSNISNTMAYLSLKYLHLEFKKMESLYSIFSKLSLHSHFKSNWAQKVLRSNRRFLRLLGSLLGLSLCISCSCCGFFCFENRLMFSTTKVLPTSSCSWRKGCRWMTKAVCCACLVSKFTPSKTVMQIRRRIMSETLVDRRRF